MKSKWIIAGIVALMLVGLLFWWHPWTKLEELDKETVAALDSAAVWKARYEQKSADSAALATEIALLRLERQESQARQAHLTSQMARILARAKKNGPMMPQDTSDNPDTTDTTPPVGALPASDWRQLYVLSKAQVGELVADTVSLARELARVTIDRNEWMDLSRDAARRITSLEAAIAREQAKHECRLILGINCPSRKVMFVSGLVGGATAAILTRK